MMPTNEPISQNSVNGTGLKSLWEVTTLRPIAENTPINITQYDQGPPLIAEAVEDQDHTDRHATQEDEPVKQAPHDHSPCR